MVTLIHFYVTYKFPLFVDPNMPCRHHRRHCLHFHNQTNIVEHNPTLETDSISAIQENKRVLSDPNNRQPFCTTAPLDLITRHINLVHTLTSYFIHHFKYHPPIIACFSMHSASPPTVLLVQHTLSTLI